jgi:hypothetical protein
MIGIITLSAIACDHTLLGSELQWLTLPFQIVSGLSYQHLGATAQNDCNPSLLLNGLAYNIKTQNA